jgi:aryl-alcohol dehydrogenase-like predicted oxidoreductase
VAPLEKRVSGPLERRAPEGTRIAAAAPEADECWDRGATDANWGLLDIIAALGEQTGCSPAQVGCSPAQVVLNWLLGQPPVVAPISLAQLDDNLGATDWALDSDESGAAVSGR